MIITTLDGKEWNKKELIKKMDCDDFYYNYLGKNALSSSAIKQMIKQGTWSYEPVKESPALRDGKMIHLMSLEPQRVKDYAFVGGSRASKLYKNLVSQIGHDLVYTVSEFNRCKKVSNAVAEDFEAFDVMEGSAKEIAEIQMIKGVAVRGKADIYREGIFIGDLKTTSDISNTMDSILHWGYHIQGALYCDMFGVDRFLIVWVDKKTLEVKVEELSKELLQQGRELYNNAIDKYNEL